MSKILRKAARYCGLRLDYLTATGQLKIIEDKVLRSLVETISGGDINNDEDFLNLIQQKKAQIWNRAIKSVQVAKSNVFCVHIYMRSNESERDLSFEILDEQKNSVTHQWSVQSVQNRPEGKRVCIEFRTEIENGYFDFKMFFKEVFKSSSFLIYPPKSGYRDKRRVWGSFSPLYAIRSNQDWGIGDLSSLKRLQILTKKWGGDFVGSLPLLPLAYEKDGDPSPYSAVSKLFWNEIYLDINDLPPLPDNGSEIYLQLQPLIADLKFLSHVDYKKVYSLKKRVLLCLSEHFFKSGQDDSNEFQDFLLRYPEAEAYAEFVEPNSQTGKNYHLYVQFQMDRQLKELTRKGESVPLYLDYPVGCKPDGFDMNYFGESFFKNISVGAPPDLLYSQGQNWGFAPLAPDKIRENRYEYFIKTLRHHMRYARYLRLDHVMSLERLYIIPEGHSAKEGAYLQYHPEEFFAILSIESQRHQVQVIGENLGTVPESIREQLNKGQYLGMWVFLFEAGTHPSLALQQTQELSLACLNTHDLIPFDGFIRGKDLSLQRQLNFLDDEEVRSHLFDRRHLVGDWCKDLKVYSPHKLQKVISERMAKSGAQMVLINLEDLWGEQNPQNVPGTYDEYPNWTLRWARTLEELEEDQEILRQMESITTQRHGELHV